MKQPTNPDTEEPHSNVAESAHGTEHEVEHEQRHQDVVEREDKLGVLQHQVQGIGQAGFGKTVPHLGTH